ncbi:low temperature requirement protein A [Micromonospora sp. KC207]|uniref:low temperature requirement protein A n=1 Tax=Micromonospora sp. KC207 TaxID=2530377 RepID=UPI001051345F|nr:low temperature requirement protein A [Micromonospora sp. KC207]TDC67084.1 low temperature requirement protein A [Micromonospora sp. KC207]
MRHNFERYLRAPEYPQQATYLELFFDLAFIFAFTRISRRLSDSLDLVNAAQTLVLLLAIFWVWTFTAWSTNFFNPERVQIQLLVIASMLGSVVLTIAVPGAFEARGLLFAGSYLLIHLGRSLTLRYLLLGHELQHVPYLVLCWFGLSSVPWILGAFAPSPVRLALWALAIAIDYLGGILLWPTPKLGRMLESQWAFAPDHLAERYRQFFNISLGETVLILGATFIAEKSTIHRTVALIVAFATSALLWRIYFYQAALTLADTLKSSNQPNRLGRAAANAHLVMVAGVVVTSVGYQAFIGQPTGHTPLAWLLVILGGPALFLAGRARFEYTVYAGVSPTRLIGVLVLAALLAPLLLAPPLVAAASVVVALTCIALADALRVRHRPPAQPSPPTPHTP